MKARIYSFKKESNEKTRYFTKVHDDLRCAVRADDRSKLIPRTTQTLLGDLFAIMQSKKSKSICVNQDYLTSKTWKKKDQNKRILSQLSDFIDYTYHRSVVHEGKRYNYAYIIKFTEDGELRATRPDLFYAIDSEANLKKQAESLGYIPQKSALIEAKMRRSYIDIIDHKKEIEDILAGYHSISKIKKEKIKIKKKEKPSSPEIKTCATSFMNELAHVTQEKPRLITCEEEKVHLRGQQERKEIVDTNKNPEFNPIASFVDKLVSSACKSGEDFQPGVETPDKYSLAEPVLDMPNPEVFNNQKSGNEMEQKEEEKAVNLDQVDTKRMQLTNKISSSFGQDKADEILDNLEFMRTKPDKVAIRAKFGFMLSEIEKRKIRACVEAVYGESTKIVSVTTIAKTALISEKTDSGTQKAKVAPTYYNKFQELKNNYKGDKAAYLDKFIVPNESNAEKLVFRGLVTNFCQNNAIIESVLKTDVTAEFWHPYSSSPDFILCPEEIQQEREYLEKLKNPENQKFVMNHPKLRNFTENLKRFLPIKSADHILQYFQYLEYSKDSTDNHIILGSCSNKEINNLLPYLEFIKQLVVYKDLKFELRYLTNSNLPIIITKK